MNLDWLLYQLDVKNAFLKEYIKKEVYMQIPPGLQNKSNNLACKLRKSLDGLKQSSHVWFDRFAKSIVKSGYHPCQTEHTIFVSFSATKKVAILIVYVDGIILAGDDEKEILKLKRMLAVEFKIKDREISNISWDWNLHSQKKRL